MFDFKELQAVDPLVAKAILSERERQETHIELIASENFTSKAVMAAAGSVFTNKYAEGYPSARYYAGCEYSDEIENLAIERAKKLFNSKFANVQPHSGASANMAAYFAVLSPNDTIMGMDLAHGGHLTHGSPVTISGKYYNAISYKVDENGFLDYESARRLAKEKRPKLIICGASAYPRAIDFKIFRDIADEIGAYLLADVAHIAGLIVAGEHQNSVPYAHFTTTTTHKTLRGPRGGLIICDDEENAKKINKAVFPGAQGGPLMHIISAKAVAFFEALKPEFKEYIKQVVENARYLAEALKERGFNLLTGGTDNHLMLLDLRNTKFTGKTAEQALARIGIICNKNAIPNDPQKPFITSGIRIGTPAVTTRGMGLKEMKRIANAISETLLKNKTEKAREDMHLLAQDFPIKY